MDELKEYINQCPAIPAHAKRELIVRIEALEARQATATPSVTVAEVPPVTERPPV